MAKNNRIKNEDVLFAWDEDVEQQKLVDAQKTWPPSLCSKWSTLQNFMKYNKKEFIVSILIQKEDLIWAHTHNKNVLS